MPVQSLVLLVQEKPSPNKDRMNSREVNDLKSIAKHVAVLNGEVGFLQKDVTKLKTSMLWSTRIITYMAALLTIIVGKSLLS